jgi:hypothetical protein
MGIEPRGPCCARKSERGGESAGSAISFFNFEFSGSTLTHLWPCARFIWCSRDTKSCDYYLTEVIETANASVW